MRTYIAISLHLSNNNNNKSSSVPHTHTKGDRNKYSSTPFFLFLFFDQLLLNTFYNKTYRILLPKKTPKDLKKRREFWNLMHFPSWACSVSVHANRCHHHVSTSGSVCQQEKNVTIYWLIIYHPPLASAINLLDTMMIWQACIGNVLGVFINLWRRDQGMFFIAKENELTFAGSWKQLIFSFYGKKIKMAYSTFDSMRG